ncbi:MAG: glycosyl transferase family 1, partial [Ardenticatenaceae bacterium]|nr:glycosyl transferase family 1 [Ardenticatenaceae bacterium]
MRILFLLTQSLESPGGAGRFFPLAKELVRLEHQVMMVALHHDFARLAKGDRAFVRDGVQVKYVAQMHVHKADNRKMYYGPLRLLWVTA